MPRAKDRSRQSKQRGATSPATQQHRAAPTTDSELPTTNAPAIERCEVLGPVFSCELFVRSDHAPVIGCCARAHQRMLRTKFASAWLGTSGGDLNGAVSARVPVVAGAADYRYGQSLAAEQCGAVVEALRFDLSVGQCDCQREQQLARCGRVLPLVVVAWPPARPSLVPPW